MAVAVAVQSSLGAQTARTEVRLDAPGAQAASLAASSQGSLAVVAWLASSAGSIVPTVAVSRDGGASFSAPRRLGREAQEAQQATTTSLGRAAVIVLSGNARDGASRPIIVAAWPAVRQGQPGIVRAESIDLGQSFTESFLRPGGLPATAVLSAMALGPGGRMHAIWLAGATVWYARTGQNGFAAPVRVDGSASRCAVAALGVGSDNTVSTVWYRSFGGKDEEFAFASSRDGGATFGSPLRVSHERWQFRSCPGSAPSLFVDDKGALRFAFQAVLGSNPAQSTFFADRSADGRTFKPRAFLEVSGFADSAHPRLASDRDGGLALAWDGVRNGRRYVMIRHSLAPPGGGGGIDADWMRPSPPIVLDQSGRGAAPVIVRALDGILAAWLTADSKGPAVAARRLSIDELCGRSPPGSR
jgi:hypothetical protein